MKDSDLKSEKHIIGWTEMIDLPDWDISRLKAKIDTGARSSALHVENIEKIGRKKIRFDVITLTRGRIKKKSVETTYSKRAKVRSSTGIYSLRYFVKTKLRVGPVIKAVEVSLVSRDKMLFRMLLGRKTLEKDFMIDCDKRYLLTDPPKRKLKKTK